MLVPDHAHREPFRSTAIRNLLIAIVAGIVVTMSWRHAARPIPWLDAVILMLWPSFGGHWIEMAYLEWIRPRLPAIATMQRVVRLATWFVGGCVLGAGMVLTAHALGVDLPVRWEKWWFGGVAFIVIELVVHTLLQLRGVANVFSAQP